MNPELEEKILAEAQAEQERLRARAQFDMLRAGRRDTADMLADPQAQEMLGRAALAYAIQDNIPEEQPGPGPQRTQKPKVSARKRQRQARRRQR
jgi:hypothetical protein